MIVPAQREQHERFIAARKRMEQAAKHVQPTPPKTRVIDLEERRMRQAFDAYRDALKPIDGHEPWPTAIRRIKRECCEGRTVMQLQRFYKREVWQPVRPMTPADLEGSSRMHHVVRVRQYAMWRCRKELRVTWLQIAQRFNRRDHTTVIHAYQRVEARIARGEAPCP
jgi:hypothetical protein